MQALFIFLCCLGSTLVYLSNRHQGLLSKPLTLRPWRWLGYLFILLALAGLLSTTSLASAIMTWAVALILFFGGLPYLPLLLPAKGRQCNDR